MKLGEKVAGKVGEEFVGAGVRQCIEFVTSLSFGNAKAAASGMTPSCCASFPGGLTDMASTKQKIWSRDEFLDLLDDEDIAALWEKWALSPADKKSKEAREFRAAVGERSKTSLLQDVLSLRTPTLQMLRDVLTFLVHQNSALRTTGSHVVLEEEFDISPQQVSAALAWSATVLRRHAAAT
jgi:hypothetical protein